MGRELGITGTPSDKIRKGFELFLKALVSDRVNSETDFSETVDKFINTSNRINIDFENMMHECAIWMKNCVAGGGKKWMKNNDMSGFDKKGFDKFYKYSPKKIRDILKSGGQPLLNIFSEDYAKEVHATGSTYDDFMSEYQYEVNQLLNKLHKVDEDSITDEQWSLIEKKMSVYDKNVMETIQYWIPIKHISAREVAQFAIENQDRYGTETRQVVNALEDFVDCLVEDEDEDEEAIGSVYSDLDPKLVKYYEENSEKLEDEWQHKMDTMEDSDFEHIKKLRNSDSAFFDFVEDKFYKEHEANATSPSSYNAIKNIPFLRKAQLDEVINDQNFITKENVEKLYGELEHYSDILDSRYSFLTTVPNVFILQHKGNEILVDTQGYDYPRYMIRIESNKSQASNITDGYVVQLDSGLYFQKEIKRSILTTTDLDKAELYPLEQNAKNHMDRLGIKNYSLVKHTKNSTAGSVQTFKNLVIASTDFYPTEDLSFDDLHSKLLEDGYNIKNKSSTSYIVADINSNSVVWVFKNGDSILLTRYAGNNPKFLIDYIYNKFEIIMEDEDIVEASTAHLKKETVHNLLEAKALIKESFSRGDEEKYNGTEFFTHKGEKLFKCIITDVEYEMVWPNGDSTIVDVMSTSSIKNWYNDKFLPVLKKHAQGEYDPMMVSKDGDTVKVFTKMYKGSNVSGIKEAFKELGIEIMEVETNASSYRGYVVGKIPKDLDNNI